MGKPLVKDFVDVKPVTGDVGIEIEVEALGRLPNVNTTWWATKTEGSLRNGLEYVTKGALPVDGLMLKRIQGLTTTIDTPEIKVNKDSFRTSVHTHHNVLDYEPVQLWTAITAYWLLENVLLKHCGPEREGNLFCLRLKDAQAVINKFVIDDLRNDDPFRSLNTDHIRYSSANLNAIPKFGSLELRPMGGTVDPKKIHDWSSGTHHLLRNATKFGSPAELLDFYFINGWRSTAARLLNEPLLSLVITTRNVDELIEENAYILSNFMYSISWHNYSKRLESKLELMKKKKEKKQKKLDNGITFTSPFRTSTAPQAVTWASLAIDEF